MNHFMLKKSDKPKPQEGNKTTTNDSTKKPKGRVKVFFYGFITGAIVLTIAFGTAFYMGAFATLYSMLFPNNAPVVTEAFISGRLEEASELVTAKYIYSGIADYEEGTVPLITKSSFSMYYTGTVRAGISDTSSIKPTVEEDKVTIVLPAAKILDVHIQPNSLRFFDQKEGLFHSNNHDQVATMLTKAESDVRQADMSDLLDLADEQMENVVRGLFEDSIGDRELIITHEKRADSTAKDADIDSKPE